MSKIPAKAKHTRKRKRRPQFSLTVGQLDDQQILPFQVWCRLNNLSLRTGRRVLASGSGPRVVQLSSHRIGVTYGDNRAWQQRGGFQKTEAASPADAPERPASASAVSARAPLFPSEAPA
jgi:hypothetical protein